MKNAELVNVLKVFAENLNEPKPVYKKLFLSGGLLSEFFKLKEKDLKKEFSKKAVRAIFSLRKKISAELLTMTSPKLMCQIIALDDYGHLLNCYFRLTDGVEQSLQLADLFVDALYNLSLDDPDQKYFCNIFHYCVLLETRFGPNIRQASRWKITHHWTQWIHNIFESLLQGEPRARRYMITAIVHSWSNGSNMKYCSPEDWNRELAQVNYDTVCKELEDREMGGDGFRSAYTYYFPLEKKYHRAMDTIYQVKSQIEKDSGQLLGLINDLCQEVEVFSFQRLYDNLMLPCKVNTVRKIDVLDTIVRLKWQEIVSQARCFIRSGGRDKIKMAVPEFRKFGIDSFVFVREGHQFPAVLIHLWYLQLEEKFRITMNLDQQGNLHGTNPGWVPEISMLLKFIIVDSYHKLVCNPGQTIPRSTRTRVLQQDKGNGQQTEIEITEVRPHFRQLPSGWKASDQALVSYQEALETDQPLPEGMTFVAGYDYERGPQIQLVSSHHWQEQSDQPAIMSYNRKRIFDALAEYQAI